MILQWWVHIIILVHLSKPIECTIPRANPIVGSGLWVIMMCQYRFIISNKYTILLKDVDYGGNYACLGAKVKREISVPSF